MQTNNAKTIIERFGFKDSDLTTPEHDKMLVKLLNIDTFTKMLNDLKISTKLPINKIQAEYAVMSGTYNVGFIDLAAHPYAFDYIFVEIKPKIRSIGELIRQINLYRSHTNKQNEKWIVVTNDATYAPILASQGFTVTK